MKKELALIGNGWLGKKLRSILSETYFVSVFSKNSSNESDVVTYILGENIPNTCKTSEIVLLTIPPRLRSRESEDVLKEHRDFFQQFSSETYFIYTSSTSVYSDMGNVDEKSNCEGNLLLIENLIRKQFKKHLIFRLGGLAGPNRPIVNYLNKKGFLDSFNSPTNLLHLEDASSAILTGIKKNMFGTYNLCCSEHPSKEEVYENWNKKFGFSALENGEKSVSHKIVSNKKFILESGFNYKFSNPLKFEF